MANIVDRVFGEKIDKILLSKGGKIIRDSKRIVIVEEYESAYLNYKSPYGHTVTETKSWNCFSFGAGAVKIRTNGKGQALLYTSTEEISLTIDELKEELDEYLLLFEEEIRAAEEEEQQREKERQLREEAARLERAKEENWDKEVPVLIQEIRDKEVSYNRNGRDYKISVGEKQELDRGRYRSIPCINIKREGIRDYFSWSFDFEVPSKKLTTGGFMMYAFDEAPEGVITYGDLYEFIKTH